MRFIRLAMLLTSVAFLGACENPLPTDAGADASAFGSVLSSSTGVGSSPEVSGTTVLDFEELDNSEGNGLRVPAPYQVEGYVLDTSTGNRFFSPSPTFRWYGGSTALFVDDISGAEAILTREDGSSFSVSSIDLARLFGSATAQVTFIGTTRGGATVQQTVSVAGLEFEAFQLDGFEDLVELRWNQAAGVSPELHQFDDIALALVSPGSKEACHDGQWQAFGFKNQGQCIRSVVSARG